MVLAFNRAELARARRHFEAARSSVREALELEMPAGGEGHRWPLVWLALRIEAEAPTAAADRVSALAELAATLPATTPPYRALAAAEQARAAGGVLSAGIAHRAAASTRPRRALTLAMAAVGAPLPLLAFTSSFPVAIALSAIFGAGSIVAEVVADTSLQRSLDRAVFARAYGFVVPANIAGIASGALLAPAFVTLLGFSGCFVIVGVAVIAFSLVALALPDNLLRRRTAPARPRPATRAPATTVDSATCTSI